MSDNAVSLAALALATTVVAGLFKLLNKLSNSIDNNTKSNDKIAKATEKGNKEAKERNGHLAELVIQSTQQNSDNLKAIADVATDKIISVVQNVEKQTVEHQVVRETKQTNKEKKV